MDRSVVEECLDKLRSTCLNQIREAFAREKSITETLQIRRFERCRDIYEEHYKGEYQRHFQSDDILSTLGDTNGQNRAALQIMSEVRSYYDCK